MQAQNNVLPTKSQNMHLHTRAQNRVPQEPNFLLKRHASPRPIGPSGAKLNWEGETNKYATLHSEEMHGVTQVLYMAPLRPAFDLQVWEQLTFDLGIAAGGNS